VEPLKIEIITLQHGMRLFPAPYRELLAEILHEPSTDRDREYVEAIVFAQIVHRAAAASVYTAPTK